MAHQPQLYDLVEELDRCTNCGLCHGICPVYLLTGDEWTSARGKINLLRGLISGELIPTHRLVDVFNQCLLCYGCQSVCPAGVRTENLWIAAREILAREVGQTFAKKVAFRGFLGKPGMMKWGLKLARLTQTLLFPNKLQYRHLPSGLTIPRLGSRTLLDDLPDRVPAVQHPPKGRIGYFVGCMSNYLLPDIANSAIRVLSQLGYEVVIPHDQICCGAPAFNNGDFHTARKLAQWNMDVYLRANVDMIVTADATCGGAFTHEYSQLFGEDDPRYREFRSRCPEILTLVAQRIGEYKSSLQPMHQQVTIHDSCHLCHTQGVTVAPREIVEAIPGVEIVEKVRSEHCCGFGGSFTVLFPELADGITARRIEEIAKTGVKTVVSSSPGCILKLKEQVDRQGLDLHILHPLELLDQSFRG
jgi:glycolate oxidase iron-sulfur subunit